ncbi:MAG: nitrate reductase [Candidatus Latescibacteria bacterium]|nr:nitrate reductase [Candidatus Latescibacterota bacterium]
MERRDFLKTGFWSSIGLYLASRQVGCAFETEPDGLARAQSWHKSVCRFCGTGCGVVVGMRDGKIVAVRGDELAHNKGMMCVKGTMLAELPKLEGRLLYPMIRKDGRLQRATWDEAMTLVADKFRETLDRLGPSGIAFYGSGQLYTQESYTANKLFKAGLKSNNVDGNPRLCMASAAFGYVQSFGKDEPPGCYEDLDHAACFFIIGANPYEAHPVLFERMRLRQKADPSVKMIVVDPRRTRTAEYADLHLPVLPGTDLMLLNSMAHVILRDNLADLEFLNVHCTIQDAAGPTTLDKMRAFYREYTPERAAREMGISANLIETAAYLFATSPATMSLWTMGINQRVQGVFLNNTIITLHLMTGQIGRPGATPFSLTGQGNACGGVRDTGSLSHALPLGHQVANPEHRHTVERLWGLPPDTLNPEPGLHTVDLFKAMKDGRIGAALIMCTNPGQTLPNLDVYRRRAEGCFLVVADAVETRTTELADVVLPAALWLEKEGVYGQAERRYQLLQKLIDPPGEARSDLDILVDLAKRLGQDSLITAHDPEAVWDEWRQMSVSTKYNFSGMTYDRLKRERGLQWPCPTVDHPGTRRRYVEGDDPLVTPGSKIDFYGKPDHKAVIFLRPYEPSPERPSETYPFLLTTGRVIQQWHTGTITNRIPALRDVTPPASLEINPEDAHRLGVTSGDAVTVASRFGTITLTVAVSPVPRTGVVFASFYDADVLINRVVADYLDPISKQPDYKTTAVHIRKA